jgi:predicted glycoside hydrolase/deacetylase ChbG (UPF0249 family)
MTKNNKLCLNADDAGISLGVNNAITQMIKRGILYSVSIFPNGLYTKQALTLCKKYPQVKTGLHFNITVGKSLSGHNKLPLLTKSNNEFRYGFIGLCFALLIYRHKLLREVAAELNAQIQYLQQNNIVIDHVNSHRHIHMIPGIFNLVYKAVQDYNIPNLRIINEKLLPSLKVGKDLSFMWNGNIIKFIILKFFNSINSLSCNVATKTYFFSILYTCNINDNILRQFFIPKGFEQAEIMIHPGNSELDKQDRLLKYEKGHLLSKNRDIEADINCNTGLRG